MRSYLTCARERKPGASFGQVTIAVSSGTLTSVFLLVVIALGYVVTWAIWHFAFRGRGDEPSDPPNRS